MSKNICLFLLLAVVFLPPAFAASYVVTEGGHTYIVDQRGERWDVTTAKKAGYNPYYFKYGMGRFAFTPLDDSALSTKHPYISRRLRVIAFTDDEGGRAFSVDKLRRHEVANSWQNGIPVAVGY